MPVDENTPLFPGDPKPEFIKRATMKENGYNAMTITLNSHTGTHIDAPYHFIESGLKLSDFPAGKFVGSAIVIDAANMDVNKIDFYNIRKNDIVFFYTGFSDNAYSDIYFKENPVIDIDIANELIKREISIFGIDSFTPDNEPYTIHKMFLEKDILILENLINLKDLAGKRFDCVISPLNLQNNDGAPCRVFAMTDFNCLIT
jgi:kynurenine formamidase